MIQMKELLDLNHTLAKSFLENSKYPWEILPNLKEIILDLQKTLDKNEYEEVSPQVFVHKSVKIIKPVFIGAPTIIGKNTELRQTAFIRESALIGENCVIGNSTEIKNAIIFDNVEVPHFNYVGDSIIGYHAHLGAGAVISNIKSDQSEVVVKNKNETIKTGLIKFGAIVGDFAEIGCNSVLNPGSIIGKKTSIYPLTSVRGVIESNKIVKKENLIVEKN